MKISELIKELEKKKEKLGDVEVCSVPILAEDFTIVDEVLDRSDYRDESYFGKPFRRGNFVVIEFKPYIQQWEYKPDGECVPIV